MSEMHKRFVRYINERYAIRNRRLQGLPRPWSNDPILNTFKFCNVKREWDWTSVWLRRNWYEPNLSGPGSDYLGLAASLARFIGHVPTLQEMGYPSTLHWMRPVQLVLERRLEAGEQAYTGAYMLKSDGRPKPQYTVETVAAPWDEGVFNAKYDDPFELWNILVEFPGWGGFMAQEVVLDLCRTWVLSGTRYKLDRFAYAGPGAQRGLNRIHGRDLKARVAKDHAYQEMFELWQQLTLAQSALHPELRHTMSLHDIEFNLCEFDKYERTRLEQGRPRSKYTQRTP